MIQPNSHSEEARRGNSAGYNRNKNFISSQEGRIFCSTKLDENKNKDDSYLSTSSQGVLSDFVSTDQNPAKNFLSFQSKQDDKKQDENVARKMILELLPPMALPPLQQKFSLKPDMQFGWKPEDIHGVPIPLYFDYETFERLQMTVPPYNLYPVYYYGPRYHDSFQIHLSFANKLTSTGPNLNIPSYHVNFPQQENILDAFTTVSKRRQQLCRAFTGLNPNIQKDLFYQKLSFCQEPYLFDSDFESGNLDQVFMTQRREFNLLMRVDSNTRGNHQWFYFSVENQSNLGIVQFNILNFTKRQSLFNKGMRVSVRSDLECKDKNFELLNSGWRKDGLNIVYKFSRLSETSLGLENPKKYYELQFSYDFKHANDKVYFAFCMPYTFSMLQAHLRNLNKIANIQSIMREEKFCYSLGGVKVPLITVTSNVQSLKHDQGSPMAINPLDFDSDERVPIHRNKKYIIVCARVHPGETNASHIMHGFLDFITGKSEEAKNLRKKNIFKILPMTNPDGVIIGNYRTGLAGNDLNRRFDQPNPKLHPIVFTIRKLFQNILRKAVEPNPIISFVDIHGHSRKKSIFMYGPDYALHTNQYFKMRILPKLLDEQSEAFRYHSCKFRVEQSKLSTARVVVNREFGVSSCFTLEASMHGYIADDRKTKELTQEILSNVGDALGQGFYQLCNILIEDQQRKYDIKQIQIKKKSKKQRSGSGARSGSVSDSEPLVLKQFYQNTLVIQEEESETERPTLKRARTFKQIVKQIKRIDEEKDSDEDDNPNNEQDFSEDELTGGELKSMQGGIIDAITNFEQMFKSNENIEKIVIKKKKNARSSERHMDRLIVRSQEPGNLQFQAKQTGNGGCCVSLAQRARSNESRNIQTTFKKVVERQKTDLKQDLQNPQMIIQTRERIRSLSKKNSVTTPIAGALRELPDLVRRSANRNVSNAQDYAGFIAKSTSDVLSPQTKKLESLKVLQDISNQTPGQSKPGQDKKQILKPDASQKLMKRKKNKQIRINL